MIAALVDKDAALRLIRLFVLAQARWPLTAPFVNPHHILGFVASNP